MTVLRPDLVVIGAGSGGLSVAAGAVQMGASVVLVEQGAMGGDCLNHGCVPSKSTIAAARTAQAMREAGGFGITAVEPEVDPLGVRAHVRAVIAGIAPTDSQERFEGLGVTVLRTMARFTGPLELHAGDVVLRPRRVVLATGSAPAVPPVPGLDSVPYLTNETVFDLDRWPEHLVVLGGGPIGVELAQAHRRLGAAVTLVERMTILPKDDPDAVAVVRAALRSDGVEIVEGAEIRRVEQANGGIRVAIGAEGGADRLIEASHLLVAAGRRPILDELDLPRAGITASKHGIEVDASLRTSNRKVFAIGDCIGGLQFTHMAGYHASIVLRQILFRLPAKVDLRAAPWVTYSEPELAQVGLSEGRARDAGRKVTALVWPFSDNDRARTERATQGFVKLLVDGRGRVVGGTMVGRHAGELASLVGLAVAQRLKIGALAQMIAPYPTLSEAVKRAAGSYYTKTLFSGRTRAVVRFLARFG